VVRFEHLVLPGAIGRAGFQQRAQDAHGAKRDLERGQPSGTQRRGEQAHDFSVDLRAFDAQAFQANLRELARSGLLVGLAEHALRIAKAEGARLAAQTRCAHARHLHGHVGAQGEQIARSVEELEGQRRNAARGAQDVHALEGRGFDGRVAMLREQRLNLAVDLFALQRFFGHNIAQSRRRNVIHVIPTFRLAHTPVYWSLFFQNRSFFQADY